VIRDASAWLIPIFRVNRRQDGVVIAQNISV